MYVYNKKYSFYLHFMYHSEHTIYTAFNKFGVYLWEIIYYYDLCLPVLPVLICVTCVDLCYLCWLLLAVLTCYLCQPVLPVNILGKNCLTCVDLCYLCGTVLPALTFVTCDDLQAKLRVYESRWSQSFSMDTVGSSGVVVCHDKERGRKYMVGLFFP